MEGKDTTHPLRHVKEKIDAREGVDDAQRDVDFVEHDHIY